MTCTRARPCWARRLFDKITAALARRGVVLVREEENVRRVA